MTTTNPLLVAHGGSGTFTIVANSGYKLSGATVSCAGGSYNQAGSLTVSNITSTRTCTITLVQDKVTFTMNTGSWGSHPETTALSCYIAKRNYYGNYDGTAIYGGKSYSNCVVDSYSMKYKNGSTWREFDNFNNLCIENHSNTSFHYNYDRNCDDDGENLVECTVSLSCDPA